MKKIILLCVCLLVLLAAGCGGQKDPSPVISAPDASSPTGGTTVPTEPSSSGETDGTAKPSEPTEPSAPSEPSSPTTAAEPPAVSDGYAIADRAVSLLGTAFRMGGVGPTEFDNPGFVYYCYKEQGIKIPRRAPQMAQAGTEVPKEQLQPGDIVIFCNDIGGEPAFVGIYVANGQFVSCDNPEDPTTTHNFNSKYFTQRFITARRYY